METKAPKTWHDEFLESCERALGFMDLSTLQPTSWRHFQPLIAKEWLEWFWKLIRVKERKQISPVQLAKTLEPALCREHLIFTLEDLKSARWPREKRLKVADFFYHILDAQMPHGDPFGLRGTTKRHTHDEVADIMPRKFQKGNPKVARELGKLYNAAYNLGAALHLDFYMGKAIENWGPYELPDGRILVIKEMRYLKVPDIWPHVKTKVHNMDLYAVYEGVKFSTDLIACHTQYEGDTIAGLSAWRLESGGKSIRTMSQIRGITDDLSEMGVKQWRHVTNLPEKTLIEKAVWIRNHCFNEVCELLGLDWRPTKKLLKAVKGKTLHDGWETWKQPKNKHALKAYWRGIWDPRKDFYPSSKARK